MDRARRAEPYSSATIWTREIARNLAGHLDRLSKVHSCVDTASPKTAHLPQFKHGHQPLKRAGQVSPLKLEQTNSHGGDDGDDNVYLNDRDTSHADESGEERDDRRESMTERGRPGDVDPTSTAREKSKKKAKSGTRRSQAEVHRLEALAVENQRLQERITKMTSSGADPLEALPVPSHSKKSVTQDYHKRHKQQQIWQENQAMAKRLKNTKPTLSSKDWEKDDKWNQQFLKTQEKRRQALHNEMSRSLASPHSALIRVKHVAGSGSHGHGRLSTDAIDDASDVAATVIEVTTTDASMSNSKGRGVRRRRFSNEDTTSASGDSRHYSTAANHRRIMELRKQREHGMDHGGVASGDGAGPTDELVSVRFTFSREGSQVRSLTSGLCTPNGITGQFSPAIELERALESASLNDEELLPVPILDPLNSGRIAEDDDQEINSIVFETLQGCIDMVASLEDDSSRLRASCDKLQEGRPSEEPQDKQISAHETDVQSDGVARAECIHQNANLFGDGDDKPQATGLEAVETAVVGTTAVVPTDQSVAVGELASANAADPVDDPASGDEVVSDPSGLDMEVSGYGSEFDVDEDPRSSSITTPSMPLIPDAPEDDGDDYEDDHTEEEPATPSKASPAHLQEDDEEAQYDDDLEPEDRGEDRAELSYSDDGFTGDD